MMSDTRKILIKLQQQKDLSIKEATDLSTEILHGKLSEAVMGACLFGLRQKGESIEEITAFVKTLRKHSTKIPIENTDLIDTAGTGGDYLSTFNVSTTVALVLAASGYKVAKHGNRSVTSKSGSADLLEALGVNIELSPKQVAACIEQVGIGFLFAPSLHNLMKNVMPVRLALNISTIFNILGPLANPASAQVQVVGVFEQALTWRVAKVLQNLKSRSAMVVCGNDGMDEVTLTGTTSVARLRPSGDIETFVFDPKKYGFEYVDLKDLKGGSAEDNARITLDIIYGKPSPKADLVAINAGFAIAAMEDADLKDGIALAVESLRAQKTKKLLENFVEQSQQMAKDS